MYFSLNLSIQISWGKTFMEEQAMCQRVWDAGSAKPLGLRRCSNIQNPKYDTVKCLTFSVGPGIRKQGCG